ncbi:DUF2784 domain-containing protein [Bdellovibrio sp. HCB337]|uniref:DUF2784 domain-containing protein n=1 Tax=Bdellovibrio sp. HCB337 TaxID=3394358 RepID=UPI0039A78049
MWIYVFLDNFFLYFHLVFSLFNLFGWASVKTRKWNLVALLITAFFWFIVGFRYGFGYCPLTDWHWQVREKLGYTDMPYSYIKFLVDYFTGWNVDAVTVDVVTMILFLVALILSIALNIRDRRRSRIFPGI